MVTAMIDVLRAQWEGHASDCWPCQGHRFTRCATGDAILAQLAESDPLYTQDSSGLSFGDWLRARAARRARKAA
jgi:hypothetical protein